MSTTGTSGPIRSGDVSSLAETREWQEPRRWLWASMVISGGFVLFLGWTALADWRLVVEQSAEWAASMFVGVALFWGLQSLGSIISKAVRVGLSPVRVPVGGSLESETVRGPVGDGTATFAPEDESRILRMVRARVALVACPFVLFALVGVGALVAGVVEWRVPVDAGVGVFRLLSCIVALAGLFLWVRFVAAKFGGGPDARSSSETESEDRELAWSAMAWAPLWAAFVLAAPTLGIRRESVTGDLLPDVGVLVLAAAAIFGLYRGGRLLWRRSGEILR